MPENAAGNQARGGGSGGAGEKRRKGEREKEFDGFSGSHLLGFRMDEVEEQQKTAIFSSLHPFTPAPLRPRRRGGGYEIESHPDSRILPVDISRDENNLSNPDLGERQAMKAAIPGFLMERK
jgi:hypothetical protein